MDNSVRCCETRIHLLDFEDSQGYLSIDRWRSKVSLEIVFYFFDKMCSVFSSNIMIVAGVNKIIEQNSFFYALLNEIDAVLPDNHRISRTMYYKQSSI